MNNFTAHPITEGVIRINDIPDNIPANVDAYLITGTKTAALIDTCISPGLYDFVRGLTSLPLIVLITHGHGDHAGQSCIEFMKNDIPLYMKNEDIPILRDGPGNPPEELSFINITDGMTFDLGGRTLETISLPGHTPGSVIFFDRKNQILFSGDTIGSGAFWMQLPYSSPLTQFLEELKRLEEMVKDYDNLIILPGHIYQATEPPGQRYINDLREATEKIISGEIMGVKSEFHYGGLTVDYKSLRGYIYDPDKL